MAQGRTAALVLIASMSAFATTTGQTAGSVRGTVVDARTIMISSNAGPSEMAGKDCHPNFFAVQPQNDVSSEAMGQYLQSKNIGPVCPFRCNTPADAR